MNLRWLKRKPKPEPAPDDMTIEELHVSREGMIELSAKHPAVAAIAEAAAEFFVAQKGVNFVTMTVWTEKLGYMNIEFRREGGMPLTTKLKKLTDLLTEYVNCPHEFDDERMKYVAVQVDKGLLKEAKSLLGI